MAFQLSCHSVGLDVEDNDSSIDASGSKEITLPIETHAGCMSTPETTSCRLGIILGEDKGIDEGEIHDVGVL